MSLPTTTQQKIANLLSLTDMTTTRRNGMLWAASAAGLLIVVGGIVLLVALRHWLAG